MVSIIAPDHRFFTRSPDGRAIFGFVTMAGAKLAACEYGEGAFVIDTNANTYNPMLHIVIGGELKIAGYGGWGGGRMGVDQNLIEAIKKGHVAIVHAFLAKGADANCYDKNGGRALHWAVGSGKIEIVKLLLDQGADKACIDNVGQTAKELANRRQREDIAAML